MPISALATSLAILAPFELLAFLGLRLALRADAHRRLGLLLALVYWTMSAAVLCWATGSLYGARGDEHGSGLSNTLVVVLVAVYLPKIVLALLTVVELLRRALLRVARRLSGRPEAAPAGWLTRARLLPRVGVAVSALTIAAIVWGATWGRTEVRIYRHEIVSDAIPPGFDGLRIVHLSDIHAASLGSSGPRLAERLVSAVNASRPDLILYTGDYGQAEDFDRAPDILGRLRARLGKFAVLGNHDFGDRERAADNWASGEDKVRKIEVLRQAFAVRGVTLLVNDARVVRGPRGGVAILGVGVHDPHHGFHDADLAAAERGAGGARFRILMAHSPQYWESAVQGRPGIHLAFVGHTHGAQMGIGVGRFVWSPAAIPFPHWGGLYQEDRQYLNVNRGTGYVGLPFRLNMPADVSVIVARAPRR